MPGILLQHTISQSIRKALNVLLFYKLDTKSGTERLTLFVNNVALVFDGNVIRAGFGVGYRTVRSTDMVSNLLATQGASDCWRVVACCSGSFMLCKAPYRDTIIATLLPLNVREMATVSKFKYLRPRFMIAMDYARVREQSHSLLAAT